MRLDMKIKKIVIALIYATLASVGHAADQNYERQESLEIEGINAGCHVCEWRPKLHEKAALEQCGRGPDGSPNKGVFECGFAEDCERICNFISCIQN